MQILLKIFKYLNFYDLKQARQVSSSWNQILSEPQFTKNEVLRFEKCYISTKTHPSTVFLKPTRAFHTVELGTDIEWEDDESMLEFLRCIGKEATCVRLAFHDYESSKYRPEFLDCFASMTNLDVPELSLQTVMNMFDYFPPQKLEHLHVREASNIVLNGEATCLNRLKSLTCTILSISSRSDGEGLTKIFGTDRDVKEMHINVVGRFSTFRIFACGFNLVGGRELTKRNVTKFYESSRLHSHHFLSEYFHRFVNLKVRFLTFSFS